MKKLLILFFLSSLVFSCTSDDTDPEPRIVFTFNGPVCCPDTWIVVRAYETGELIGSQEITSNEPVLFESAATIPNNKLSITWSYRYSGSSDIVAVVYNQVDVGTVWEPIKDNGIVLTERGRQLGEYDLKITGVENLTSFSVSDQFDQIGSRGYSGNTVSSDVAILEGASEHIVSLNTDGKTPKYATISDFSADESINLSYDDFKDFDRVLNVKLPSAYEPTIYVMGYPDIKKSRGYFLATSPIETGIKEFNLGFLDRFENYFVQFGTSEFIHLSRGPVPTSIDYVDANKFNVTDKTLSGYAVTTAQNYNYRIVNYQYEGNDVPVYVAYYEPSGTGKHHDPYSPEMVEKLKINVAKIKYRASTFYVKSVPYNEMLQQNFNHKPQPFVIENAYVTVR